MDKNVESSWVLPSWLRGWERFWFTPADPTLLGLMRLLAGSIICYTLLAYSFHLPQFMGKNAWVDLKLRLSMTRERPVTFQPVNKIVIPTFPDPTDPIELRDVTEFKKKYGIDLRVHGLPIPKNEEQRIYLEEYTEKYRTPPPAYPVDAKDDEYVKNYIKEFNEDPRRLYGKGAPFWSLFFHVTDPDEMLMVHYAIVFISFLFTIGFATRVTSVLTWLGFLTYVHRNTQVLFGADTMYTILLTYFMLGPSGAALSVDRLIVRWWSRAKPGVVRGWYRLIGRPEPTDAEMTPVEFDLVPQPSVSANVALRLMQIHVSIVYLVAGVSKLLGPSWWGGIAVWGTVANSEFAPLQNSLYRGFIEFICDNPFFLNSFLNIGTFFTLVFEIGYAFLIWRPSLRWLFLAGAILLHGLIGMLMGLKTFALIMLVMNMAFLTPNEVAWMLGSVRWLRNLFPTGRPPSLAPALAEPRGMGSKTAVKAQK